MCRGTFLVPQSWNLFKKSLVTSAINLPKKLWIIFIKKVPAQISFGLVLFVKQYSSIKWGQKWQNMLCFYCLIKKLGCVDTTFILLLDMCQNIYTSLQRLIFTLNNFNVFLSLPSLVFEAQMVTDIYALINTINKPRQQKEGRIIFLSFSKRDSVSL